MKKSLNIRIKSPEELKILRDAGKILAGIFEEIKRSFKVGMTTADIDRMAEELIARNNVLPAFKGYRGYPACACVSVNEVIVHGIPGARVVKEGDIVSIDIGIIYREYFSDMAMTLGAGSLAPSTQKLLDVTRQALARGIEQARSGRKLGEVSHAIQKYAEAKGFSVVRDFVGHGIGLELHEDPEIPNYGPANDGPVLKPGMVLAIEPMVNAGMFETKTLEDGWTVITKDKKWSAHFEHTIAVTESGPVVLTQV
ncbi:MAG: type I methionyl aminopeptidase [Candidatus Omnitrophica bacterium]|nr:type I methionyl aminopeptidase [Candidatus Omnitrophota bacterium]